jgi:hypothetical protein
MSAIPNTGETPMLTPDHQVETRLECLRIASGAGIGFNTTELAQAFYDFVSGEPASSPREKIDAALDDAGVTR